MLNDTPRNEKYRQAIKKAVQSRGEAGPKLVVDIGTGTGLLSVMAAQVGAQKVFGVDSSEVTIILSSFPSFLANDLYNSWHSLSFSLSTVAYLLVIDCCGQEGSK